MTRPQLLINQIFLYQKNIKPKQKTAHKARLICKAADTQATSFSGLTTGGCSGS
jgi:hypothetical protein